MHHILSNNNKIIFNMVKKGVARSIDMMPGLIIGIIVVALILFYVLKHLNIV